MSQWQKPDYSDIEAVEGLKWAGAVFGLPLLFVLCVIGLLYFLVS